MKYSKSEAAKPVLNDDEFRVRTNQLEREIANYTLFDKSKTPHAY